MKVGINGMSKNDYAYSQKTLSNNYPYSSNKFNFYEPISNNIQKSKFTLRLIEKEISDIKSTNKHRNIWSTNCTNNYLKNINLPKSNEFLVKNSLTKSMKTKNMLSDLPVSSTYTPMHGKTTAYIDPMSSANKFKKSLPITESNLFNKSPVYLHELIAHNKRDLLNKSPVVFSNSLPTKNVNKNNLNNILLFARKSESDQIQNTNILDPNITVFRDFDQHMHLTQESYDDLNLNWAINNNEIVKDQYQLEEEVGRGSFGRVYKAFDMYNGRYVAIKFVKKISTFENIAIEEIRMLHFLATNDPKNEHNIVRLEDHFEFKRFVCLVFPLLSINLFQLVSRNNFIGFSIVLVRKFTLCILKCLQLLHRCNVIHCDLKPENILLEKAGYPNLKVIDFGSSSVVEKTIYAYIQSRFYRAPEVILGNKYSTPIDLWSLGCIIMELITGVPLFPGEDEEDQIACIVEVLGLPPTSCLKNSKRSHHFFQLSGQANYILEQNLFLEHNMTDNLKKQRMKRADPGTLSIAVILNNTLEHVDGDLQNFIESCLKWEPELRINAEEALNHPWICNRDEKQVAVTANNSPQSKTSSDEYVEPTSESES